MSLNIQKYAHIKNEALGAQRLPYHKIKVWWVGMVVNAIGEVGNLVAYGYAEATVVTPIGAVGVIFSAVIATFILNEKFARIHAVGIFFIIVGVVLIVYSKGNEKVLASLTLAFRVHTHTPTHTHNTIVRNRMHLVSQMSLVFRSCSNASAVFIVSAPRSL